jgi:hypothetical protein
MTDTERELRKILPIDQWLNKYDIAEGSYVAYCASELESLIPSLVALIEREREKFAAACKAFHETGHECVTCGRGGRNGLR